MEISLAAKKKRLKELNTQLKGLQEQLVVANKAAGIDENISVKIGLNQARFERVKVKGKKDKGIGKFLIELAVTTKERDVLIPITIATGKKAVGFMYHIEGSAEGKVSTAEVKSR
ncbi:MAG TPA: hypothetical protein PKD95_03580, partial [Candidatus Paceibacterota bacterium]|nr:hypothetical protein [Candidatus Paceibacterota bacterium]